MPDGPIRPTVAVREVSASLNVFFRNEIGTILNLFLLEAGGIRCVLVLSSCISTPTIGVVSVGIFRRGQMRSLATLLVRDLRKAREDPGVGLAVDLVIGAPRIVL